ncbi:MAG: 6-oxocyclohex-1-ene-1-carbonyl-CoA hydratase [Acidobacteria bacterium]|nr:6-oxocyclohex-1-ene-1-carbonyl-CoA hydratase [Acidobacteriota bacterium]
MTHHALFEKFAQEQVLYEKRPALDEQGRPVEGLFNAWILLNNPNQFNSYTTEMVKDVIRAFNMANHEQDVCNIIFTAVGDKSFCTGGNTKEYAETYAGSPEGYREYMRLFNDMVSAILISDKPVICRVNGMRIAGGQEIGMACDFTVAADTARFGQAGPKHGSAPDGGSTDFLPLFVGIEQAMYSCTLCETWSAHKAQYLGLISEFVPVLKYRGEWIANPMVVTDRFLDPFGKIVFGEFKTGQERDAAKTILAQCETDLSLLDATTESYATRLMLTMPGCLTKTLQSLRKHKLHWWDANKETNRAWLGLNMMTEARLGFRAFNEGPKNKREIDFCALRRRLAEGERWSESFIDSLIPRG